jgi:hypothetical protein
LSDFNRKFARFAIRLTEIAGAVPSLSIRKLVQPVNGLYPLSSFPFSFLVGR